MKFILSAAALLCSTAFAHAGAVAVAVPEIDALAGLSAFAVVGSIAALIWERRRK